MMSAAMLLIASAEPANVRPMSADQPSEQSTGDDISFAKSLSDRVGEPVLPRGKSSAEETTIALTDLKAVIAAKKLDEAAETPGAVGKTIAGPEIFGKGGLSSVAAYKAAEPQASAVTATQGKIAASDSGTKKVDSPVDESEGADVVPSNSPSLYAALSSGATSEIPVAPVSITGADRPLVPGADSPAVQKQTQSIGKTKEIAVSKKAEKAQETSTTSKVGQKAVSTAVNTTFKPTPVIVREVVPPNVQGAVPAVVVPRNDTGKTTEEDLNKVVLPAMNASPEASFATASALIHKETGQATKAVVQDPETAAPSAVGQPKSETTQEKSGTVATLAGSDGDSQGQSAPGASTALTHSVAGAVLASGNSPTAIMAGNTSGELTAAKLPVGDAGARTAGMAVLSREQNQPGVGMASINEAPQMLTATPTALEVGIQNGTHGWLSVRAEMADGGVVNASVSATSSAGQEMLHRELPALTAYLQEEKVAVNAIVVHTTPAVASEGRNSAGADGAGGQAQQRGNEGGDQQQSVRKQILNDTGGTMTYPGLQGVDEDGLVSLATYESGGSWLSVRA
jgi:hypothetical protein